jgi:hypothetical protein
LSPLIGSRYGLVLVIKVAIFGFMLLMGNQGRKYAARAAFRQRHLVPDVPGKNVGVSGLAVAMEPSSASPLYLVDNVAAVKATTQSAATCRGAVDRDMVSTCAAFDAAGLRRPWQPITMGAMSRPRSSKPTHRWIRELLCGASPPRP